MVKKISDEDNKMKDVVKDEKDKREKKDKKRKQRDEESSKLSNLNGEKKLKNMQDITTSSIDEIKVEDPFENAEWKQIETFEETGISQKILGHLNANFAKPTPIQSICWPIVLKGRDIIGIAETGSGKTLAFGLPALNLIHSHQTKKENSGTRKNEKYLLPRVLIMTPTRELALQIQEQLDKFGSKLKKCVTLCVFGGVPKYTQKQALKEGVDIIIGCPGRITDLLSDSSLDISAVEYLVLDEGDRLLDSGFEKEVRDIIAQTREKRQIAMFSATWPSSVEKLAVEFLSRAVKVTIGSQDLGANSSITQIVEVISPESKEARLLELLKKYHGSRVNKIIVFALYKKEAARLERYLQGKGWNCVCIQGDMTQEARSKAFYDFKNGTCPLLIATDVAARGLDIPKVEYVINFTFPLTIEDYVHRIGRTGRAGLKGIAHTFFTHHEKAKSGELINLLKQTSQEVPSDLMGFGTTVKKKEHSAYGAFFKEIDPSIKPTKITFDSD